MKFLRRSMRTFAMAILGLLTLLSALAGCLGPSDNGTQSGVEPSPVWVHGPGGVALDAAEFAGELPRFEQRPTGGNANEPVVAFARDGTAFYGSFNWDGLAQGNGRTQVIRSMDDGSTWEDVSPTFLGKRKPEVGGDNRLFGDPLTQRVFSLEFDLGTIGLLDPTHALDHLEPSACLNLFWTEDLGETWTYSPDACPFPIVNDHPSFFGGPAGPTSAVYPTVLYICANQLYAAMCTRSLDGGLIWDVKSPAFTEAQEVAACGPAGNSKLYRAGLTGQGVASPVDGAAYLPHLSCGKSWVARSLDYGLTWERLLVDEQVGVTEVDYGPEIAIHAAHDGAVAVDAEGNVYFVFPGRNDRPWLSVSHDRGETWSEPVDAGFPGLTAMSNVHYNVVAGDAGRIALFYVGTTLAGGYKADVDSMAEANWFGFVGLSLNALDANPVFATTYTDSPDNPLVRGPCMANCLLGDYMDASVNPNTGNVWIALADRCDATCSPDVERLDDERIRGAVAVQVAGATIKDGG